MKKKQPTWDFLFNSKMKGSFEEKASLSLHRILAYLCQTSTKYQIIVYLSDKEEVSIQQLAQELLISEATLNRHLAF